MHGTFQRRSPSAERRSVTPSSSSTVLGSPAQTSCTASVATGIAGYLGNPVVAIADLLSSRHRGDGTMEEQPRGRRNGSFVDLGTFRDGSKSSILVPDERAASTGNRRGGSRRRR